MTTPRSDGSRIEYLMERRELEDEGRQYEQFVYEISGGTRDDREDWVHHLAILHRLAWFLANEPTRTRRLHRLAYENWLAECDLAPEDRHGVLGVSYGPQFFDRPASTSAGLLSGATLAGRVADSRLATRHLTKYFVTADDDRTLRADLVVSLASALYEREHGEPPKTPDALVGPYLERLPEGYVAPPPTTPEP